MLQPFSDVGGLFRFPTSSTGRAATTEKKLASLDNTTFPESAFTRLELGLNKNVWWPNDLFL